MSNTEYPLWEIKKISDTKVFSHTEKQYCVHDLEKHEYGSKSRNMFQALILLKQKGANTPDFFVHSLILHVNQQLFNQKVCQWPCVRAPKRVISCLLIKKLVFRLSYSLGPEKCSVHFHVFVICVVLGLKEEIVS